MESDEGRTVCPECQCERLVRDYERAEVICGNCGLVLSDSIIDE
ncbi:MAG: TFIIB-type zinc ribbon-containing protein, partial [Thermoplasmata archaeon]